MDYHFFNFFGRTSGTHYPDVGGTQDQQEDGTQEEEQLTEFSTIISRISSLDGHAIGHILDEILSQQVQVENTFWTPECLNEKILFNSEMKKLSILALIFIGGGSPEHNIPAFRLKCGICENEENIEEGIFDSIGEFINHMQDSHQDSTIMSNISRLIMEIDIIRDCTGISIKQGDFAERGKGKIVDWHCCAPRCKTSGKGIENYIDHMNFYHNDKFSVLSPIWANIFRWQTTMGYIPTIGEFFDNITAHLIEFQINGGEPEPHVLFNTKLAEITEHNISVDQREGHIVQSNVCDIEYETDFSIIPQSPAFEFFSSIGTISESLTVEEGTIDFEANDHIFEEEWSYQSIADNLRNESQITSSEVEDSQFIISDEDAYNQMIEDMIQALKDVDNGESLDSKIDEWEQIRFCEDAINYQSENEECPIVIKYLMNTLTLPKSGIRSPYPGENKRYNNQCGVRSYVKQIEKDWEYGEAIPLSTIYHWPILGKGRFRAFRQNGEVIKDKLPHKCPFYDCEFWSCQRKTRHENNIKHTVPIEGFNESELHLLKKYGPFWGPQIAHVRKHGTLPTCRQLLGNPEIHLCTERNCNCFFKTKQNVAQHLRNPEHKLSLPRNYIPNSEQGEIRYISQEEEINIRIESEEQERISNARPIMDTTQNTVITRNEHSEEAVTQEEHEQQTITQETEEVIDDQINDGGQINNENLIAQARQWISTISTEEDSNTCIPTLTVTRRKKVKKDLITLFATQINPLMRRYQPKDDSEEEKIKLDGAVLRASKIIREHCRSKLGLSQENMNRGSNRTNNNTRRNANENEIWSRKLSLMNDSAKTIQTLTELRDIKAEIDANQEGIETQVQVNRKSKLHEKLLTIISQREEDWTREVFGGNSIEKITETINLDSAQFENRIEWLRSKIDEIAPENKKKQEVIRELFRDNPRKCLNRYVWPKTTPECTLRPEQFEEHYGPEWSLEMDNYVSPLESDAWKIDKTVNKVAFETKFLHDFVDTKKIEAVIRSRNYISAHGRDGISNAVYRLAGKEGIEFFKIIFEGILISKHIPSSWKKSRTIMLYKKGDPSEPKNWRPVSITSTMYRILTAHIAGIIMKQNEINTIFHKSQRGFVGGGSGTSDHINMLNELLYRSRRINEECVLTAIDLTNAFGSVPHQLIFDTLEAKGFSDSFMEIIKDLYTGAGTSIEVGGKRGGMINIKRGVIQGCPLSPLLFNACIDPLLTHIERFNHEDGISYREGENNFCITTQAYADDVVLVARNIDSAQREIHALENFAALTGLRIAPQKCISIARIHSENPILTIEGTEIPIKNQRDSINYLGAPISARKSTRLGSAKPIIEEIKAKTIQLFKSQLSLSQKVEGLRCYVLPKMDYMLTNGQFPVAAISKLDRFIRGKINDELNAPRTPIQFVNIATRYGGLGIPNLEDKADMLKVTNLLRQLTSKQDHLSAFSRTCIEEEAIVRQIEKLDNDDLFFDWRIEDGLLIARHQRGGTNCAAMRALEGCERLNIALRRDNGDKKFVIHDLRQNISYSVDSPRSVNQAITTINQKRLVDDIKGNLARGHSFTGKTTIESHSYRSTRAFNDPAFKFMIKGRTNTLPTPANLAAWFNKDPRCPKCGEKCTLCHILNHCRNRMQQYTWRHNLVVTRLRDAIHKKFHPDIYRESCQIDLSQLTEDLEARFSDEVRLQRPDIYFVDNDTDTIYIGEVTCPYNQESSYEGTQRNTLESRQEHKEEKYARLVEEVKNITGKEVKLLTFVISSLGHVTQKTKNALKSLFGETAAKKLAEGMSADVIKGSASIYSNKMPIMYGLKNISPFPQFTNGNTNNNDSTSNQEAQNNHEEQQIAGDQLLTQNQSQTMASEQDLASNVDQIMENTQNTNDERESTINTQNTSEEGDSIVNTQSEEVASDSNNNDSIARGDAIIQQTNEDENIETEVGEAIELDEIIQGTSEEADAIPENYPQDPNLTFSDDNQ